MEHRVARVVERDALAQLAGGPGQPHAGDGGEVGQHAPDQELGGGWRRSGSERGRDVPDEVQPAGRTLTISTANVRLGPS